MYIIKRILKRVFVLFPVYLIYCLLCVILGFSLLIVDGVYGDVNFLLLFDDYLNNLILKISKWTKK